jgi:UDP-N-acetylglucosamine--dolichyl-phosphate N-acetylglucosaminephosphotransferase
MYVGLFYFVYMGMLAVFSTNTINIYAGINGLEAGQSLIIAIAILTANVYELSLGAGINSPHLFSAMLAMPFTGITCALLKFNLYPAQIFVGDTFCYFAGMTFAVMGILGHFSKTLLLFFMPQILNFLVSIPQLFKIYPCPRHRMPDYDPERDVLVASTFTMKTASGDEAKYTNFTLINIVLRVFGPMHERTAVNVLLALQIISCAAGLFIRYSVSQFVYPAAAPEVAQLV